MNPNNFQKGDQVMFTTREGALLQGTYDHHCPNGKAYIRSNTDGKAYEREYKSIRKVGEVQTDFRLAANPNGAALTPTTNPDWDINKRFEFLQQLVRMVLKGNAVSLIVTGAGGLGKTYCVKRELRRRQLTNREDYVYIKGFSTPRGLYRTLYENQDKIIVFDDCDEVLLDPIAKNLLKGALDSYDEREIHWITKSSDETLPDSFVFTGRVIFISNRDQRSMDQALLSRSMCIDLSMSREDIMTRMEFILHNSKEFMFMVPLEDKLEALHVIQDNLENVRELSLRSLEKVINLKVGAKDNFKYDEEDMEDFATNDWKQLAKYMLCNN